MLEDITQRQFTENIGTVFRFPWAEGQVIDLTLAEVVDHGSTDRQQQFSLIFHGPVDAPPRQGIYQLQHSSLGALDLFLVPVARDATGLAYEAVINRFVESAN